MSYRARVYRHRNPQAKEEKPQPFFSRHDQSKNKQTGSFFQRKLAINKPGDQYEREADSVADALVNQPANKPLVQQKEISGIQRLSSSSEDEKFATNDARMRKDKEVQRQMDPSKDKEKMKGMRKMDNPIEMDKEKMKGMRKTEMPREMEEEKKSAVQTKDDPDSESVSPEVSSVVFDNAGKGRPLPEKTLKEMNRSFGLDFSEVTLHDDNTAIQMNRQINAQAFTFGNDIYFNKGKFNPDSAAGKRLLAHELTHTVQQVGKPPLSFAGSSTFQKREDEELSEFPEKADGE